MPSSSSAERVVPHALHLRTRTAREQAAVDLVVGCRLEQRRVEPRAHGVEHRTPQGLGQPGPAQRLVEVGMVHRDVEGSRREGVALERGGHRVLVGSQLGDDVCQRQVGPLADVPRGPRRARGVVHPVRQLVVGPAGHVAEDLPHRPGGRRGYDDGELLLAQVGRQRADVGHVLAVEVAEVSPWSDVSRRPAPRDSPSPAGRRVQVVRRRLVSHRARTGRTGDPPGRP